MNVSATHARMEENVPTKSILSHAPVWKTCLLANFVKMVSAAKLTIVSCDANIKEPAVWYIL